MDARSTSDGTFETLTHKTIRIYNVSLLGPISLSTDCNSPMHGLLNLFIYFFVIQKQKLNTEKCSMNTENCVAVSGTRLLPMVADLVLIVFLLGNLP